MPDMAYWLGLSPMRWPTEKEAAMKARSAHVSLASSKRLNLAIALASIAVVRKRRVDKNEAYEETGSGEQV